ncbi:MAG TPA: PQQ-dependent sugar dehydrogenase [Candidatus Limnocylindria bacterium]|jgi:glucose/arabinose dehydrogenase|nr:PQQ-dependent sugar dehydrogenase [Candidatus Limnocylindria bacterium]
MHGQNGLDRRAVAAMLAAVALVGCSSPTGSPTAAPSGSNAPTPSPVAPSPSLAPSFGPLEGVSLEPIAEGLADPIGITSAGDGSGRLFVNERGGRIRVVSADGTLQGAPFVDLSDRIQAGGEQGLLGVAFHPDFATNGRVFVHYSRAGDGATVISELTASADRATADPASERVIFTLHQPFANHNGGQIAFGPDGYFYIGLGDGGSGGDPMGNGQNRQVLLGKILRLDVDGPTGAEGAYAIPDSNPYAAGGIAPGDGLPEIWAYGLRNPWRFSFDRGTGDLYIGDVGQGSWEEIDRQPAGSSGGENYGWDLYEGTHCSTDCAGVTVVLPLAEYGHDEDGGCSVSGGYVYRGTRQPAMLGTYLFGDYCSGTIWTLPEGDGVTPRPLAEAGLRISSFGEGEDGEIYLVDLSGGGLYRVVTT